MYIISAGEDAPDVVPRLARLMRNFERGARVFEWRCGARPAGEADAGEAGNADNADNADADNIGEADGDGTPMFDIEVPGETEDAPPMFATYQPSVGVISYIPGTEGLTGIRAFVDRLRVELRRLDAAHPPEHTMLPVELNQFGMLTQRPQLTGETAVSHSFVVNKELSAWNPNKEYPGRLLKYVGYPGESVFSTYPDLAIPHVSFRAGFTWYILPAPLVAYQESGDIPSFWEFNVRVSTIFLDPDLPPPDETGRPTLAPLYTGHGIVGDSEHLRDWLWSHDVSRWNCNEQNSLVIIGDRLELIGEIDSASSVLPVWISPTVPKKASSDVLLANVDACGLCLSPLSSIVYGLPHSLIEPYAAALCRWCFGCLPPSLQAHGFAIAGFQPPHKSDKHLPKKVRTFRRVLDHSRVEKVVDDEDHPMYLVRTQLKGKPVHTWTFVPWRRRPGNMCGRLFQCLTDRKYSRWRYPDVKLSHVYEMRTVPVEEFRRPTPACDYAYEDLYTQWHN